MRSKGILSKGIVFTTLAAMSVTALVGCGADKTIKNNNEVSSEFNKEGYPIVDEKIELKAMTHTASMSGDFNNMSIFTELSKNTNVDVKFDLIPETAWIEQKNLTIASNSNMPDLFYGGGLSNKDIESMAKQGMLVPLDDLIKDYAPNIQKLLDEDPELKRILTSSDGKIYTLPKYDKLVQEEITTHLYINKKWLDKLGLKVPENLDEFNTILKAFKTQDPNGNGIADEIPLTYKADDAYWGEGSFFGTWGQVDNFSHLALKNGKVSFTANLDSYKEAIKWVRNMYSEGIIDKEIFTQDMSQYTSKGQNDVPIVGAFFSFFPSTVVGSERAAEDYVTVPVLKGPNGEGVWGRSTYGYFPGCLAITSENKNTEATIRWANELYDEELSLRLRWGGDLLKKEGEKYIFNKLPEGKSFDQAVYENSPGPRTPCAITEEMYEKVVFSEDHQRKKADFDLYEKSCIEPFPVMILTQEDLDKKAVFETDINKYVTEMKGKWITGGSDIDKDWNTYLDSLNKMGVNEYVELYQKNYDKAKGK